MCRHVSIWGLQNCVCLYPEWKSHRSFINISNWYINEKVFTSKTAWKFKNLKILLKKFEARILTRAEELKSPNFVNISLTLVIDTSMERSSREMQHGNPKIWRKKSKKVRNSNFDLWRRAEITLVSSIAISPTLVIDASMGRFQGDWLPSGTFFFYYWT